MGRFYLFTLLLLFSFPGHDLYAASGDDVKIKFLLSEAEAIIDDEPEKAVGMLHEALSFDQKNIKAELGKIYCLLGDAYYYLDKIDLSLENYHKSSEINTLSGNDESDLQIMVLGYLGFLYDLKEQHLIALDYYTQALQIARKVGNKAEIATNLANIGKIQTLQGYYKEALQNMEEALAIDSESGDESMIAIDLNTIGRIYEAWGMFDKAAEYLKKALAINVKLNQEDKVAIRLSGLGLVYKAWGKHDIALDYFEQALTLDKKLKNNDKIALRHANIGSTYLAMGQTDKAITYLKLGLDFFEKNQMFSYVSAILIDLGKCYLNKKEYRLAEEAFLKSIDYSKPGRLNRNIMNSLEQLSQLYYHWGRLDQAFHTQNRFMTYKDSIFNAETQEKIAEFQALYELDHKQQQIELMLLDQEISRKRHVNSLLIFSVMGLVLVIMLLGLLIRLRNHQNRRLKAEKENEALRADLEQRNKELTFNAMCIVKNNETMVKMVEAVDSALEAKDDKIQLKNIVHQLQKMEQDKSWEEFEVRFIQTHQGFYNNLQARFPDLTPNERKLCAFLRLNMSTKDIAAITHQSINSINVARTRLRKKIGIDGTDENLIGFLHSL
jgi:tetratricopeptide (TPR) repeat protein/DNA-binding CsgD family transcriptional regulator